MCASSSITTTLRSSPAMPPIVARCYVRPQDAVGRTIRRMRMSQVAVWARIPVQPGKREEAIAAMQLAYDHVVENETGTTCYTVHEDAKDPDAIYFYELYTDQAALEAHGKSDAMKAIGPALGPLMAGRPELKFYTP